MVDLSLSYWFARGRDTASRGWPATFSPGELPIGSSEWKAWHEGHAQGAQEALNKAKRGQKP